MAKLLGVLLVIYLCLWGGYDRFNLQQQILDGEWTIANMELKRDLAQRRLFRVEYRTLQEKVPLKILPWDNRNWGLKI